MKNEGRRYFHPELENPVSKEQLKSGKRQFQIEVMRDWFFRNYEDPAQSTPYESAEGGYIYIWGGPYDAREELEAEFGATVSQKAIDKLVEELESDSYEWSGKPSEDEYDDFYYDAVSSNTDAHGNLINALTATRQLLSAGFPKDSQELLFRLLYVNVVTALEAFLADVFINAVLADEKLLRKFVSSNPDFRDRKFTLNELFDCLDTIQKDVRNYLLDLIWHNLPKVKEMFAATFGIIFPDTMKPLYSAIAKRHDVVHRNGKTKKGKNVDISRQDVEELMEAVRSLADHVDEHFSS